MPFFAVTYTYTADAAARDEHRPAHRAFLGSLLDAGTLAASGPLAAQDGADGALVLVRADDAAGALAVLDADPFWALGLVADRAARAWTPVIGPWAAEVS